MRFLLSTLPHAPICARARRWAKKMKEIEIRNQKKKIYDVVGEIFDCPHLHSEIRRHEGKGGTIRLCRQCRICGSILGEQKWISQNGYSKMEIHDLPSFDQNLKSRWSAMKSFYYFSMSGIVQEKAGGDFWERYEKHMNSVAWQKLRNDVISRASGICEYCLDAPIEEVHHLTYDNFGQERLADLLGVCRRCHRLYHPHL